MPLAKIFQYRYLQDITWDLTCQITEEISFLEQLLSFPVVIARDMRNQEPMQVEIASNYQIEFSVQESYIQRICKG